jgi:hypothetical protein
MGLILPEVVRLGEELGARVILPDTPAVVVVGVNDVHHGLLEVAEVDYHAVRRG